MNATSDYPLNYAFDQGRTGRGIHGLPKVSPGPAMLNLSTPCGRANPETALRLFQGCPACRAGGLRSSSTLLDTPRRTGLGARCTRFANFRNGSDNVTMPCKSNIRIFEYSNKVFIHCSNFLFCFIRIKSHSSFLLFHL